MCIRDSSTAAVFVTKDTTTRGDWRSGYGTEGYWINGKGSSYPNYSQVGFANSDFWIWTDNTTDVRALLSPGGTGRIASCAYQATSFDVNLDFTDGRTHRVAFYLCDWDNAGRSETVQVLNASTGAVLHSHSISGFSQGQYLVYDLKGSLKIRFSKQSGFNAVLNGLFFSQAGTQL